MKEMSDESIHFDLCITRTQKHDGCRSSVNTCIIGMAQRIAGSHLRLFIDDVSVHV